MKIEQLRNAKQRQPHCSRGLGRIKGRFAQALDTPCAHGWMMANAVWLKAS